MFPASQPSRPKLHSPQHQNPLFQQQTRNLQYQPTNEQPPSIPKNQVEAMPPSRTPAVPFATPHPAVPVYNPAMVHPVFFTDGWRKPPFPLPFNAAFNPVAAGYAFANGQQRAENRTKL